MVKRDLLTYHHTQKAPWFLLLFAFAVLFFTLTWSLWDEPALLVIFPLFVGTVMCMFGFMGAIARYQAGEVAPVGRDTFNYLAEGTKDGVQTVATAVAAGLNQGMAETGKTVRCPKRPMFITAAVYLALGTQSSAGPADEGWSVLSDSLSHFQEPFGDWYTADSVRVNRENDRQFQGEPGTGILVNGKTGRTHNLITRDQWGDLEVQLEFMIPRRSNSGVKLHGVYEIQIYDSAGKTGKLTGADCGGIYPRGEMKPRYHHLDDGIAPRVNAAKKPGEWQTLQIVFRAPRFNATNEKITNARFERVLLNGKVIHDHVELLHPTGNAWKDKEQPTGPLLIQADHGPVAFRNVRVRPLDK